VYGAAVEPYAAPGSRATGKGRVQRPPDSLIGVGAANGRVGDNGAYGAVGALETGEPGAIGGRGRPVLNWRQRSVQGSDTDLPKFRRRGSSAPTAVIGSTALNHAHAEPTAPE
jgi:hypothetical protein